MTGTGKTRTAHEMAKPGEKLVCLHSLKWFDGCEGADVVILDDFRNKWCFETGFTWLLSVLDRYAI